MSECKYPALMDEDELARIYAGAAELYGTTVDALIDGSAGIEVRAASLDILGQGVDTPDDRLVEEVTGRMVLGRSEDWLMLGEEGAMPASVLDRFAHFMRRR